MNSIQLVKVPTSTKEKGRERERERERKGKKKLGVEFPFRRIAQRNLNMTANTIGVLQICQSGYAIHFTLYLF